MKASFESLILKYTEFTTILYNRTKFNYKKQKIYISLICAFKTMSPLLKTYINQRIVIITTEGKCLTARLLGFDKSINLVLSDVEERFTGTNIASGYFLQGSQVVCCGLIGENNDEPNNNVSKLQDTKNFIEMEHEIWGRVWREKLK